MVRYSYWNRFRNLNHEGFYCHSRRAKDNKSIIYRLYKKVTFTNKSVKIVLRNRNVILSTLTVKQMQVISGVDPLVTVRTEFDKIVKYIEVLYG